MKVFLMSGIDRFQQNAVASFNVPGFTSKLSAVDEVLLPGWREDSSLV